MAQAAGIGGVCGAVVPADARGRHRRQQEVGATEAGVGGADGWQWHEDGADGSKRLVRVTPTSTRRPARVVLMAGIGGGAVRGQEQPANMVWRLTSGECGCCRQVQPGEEKAKV